MAPSPHHKGKTLEFDVKDREKGKEISPKDLNIVWGEDNRYWSVPNEYGKPAELYQVCWLEVTGWINKVRPDKDYEVGFNVSLKPDAFGWGGAPVYVMAKRGKGGKFKYNKKALDTDIQKSQQDIIVKLPKSENTVAWDSEDFKVYFGLFEVWSGRWKGGLKLNHAFVRELQSFVYPSFV